MSSESLAKLYECTEYAHKHASLYIHVQMCGHICLLVSVCACVRSCMRLRGQLTNAQTKASQHLCEACGGLRSTGVSLKGCSIRACSVFVGKSPRVQLRELRENKRTGKAPPVVPRPESLGAPSALWTWTGGSQPAWPALLPSKRHGASLPCLPSLFHEGLAWAHSTDSLTQHQVEEPRPAQLGNGWCSTSGNLLVVPASSDGSHDCNASRATSFANTTAGTKTITAS